MPQNKTEQSLKKLYDTWTIGNEKEEDPKYSTMFQMGFPDEYESNGKPLLMYVGKECLRCNKNKTQEWIRTYQIVQKTKQFSSEINEGTNCSPFWNFYRRLFEFEHNVLWNNLDKLHLNTPNLKQQPLPETDAVLLNQAYGPDKRSILQREIALLQPQIIVLSIGKGKYTASLAAAFSIEKKSLLPFAPTVQNPISEISSILGLNNVFVFWTYHPAYLQRRKAYHEVLLYIQDTIKKQHKTEE